MIPRLDLTSDEARRLVQGARLLLPQAVPASRAAFAPGGGFVALVTAADGRLRCLVVFT